MPKTFVKIAWHESNSGNVISNPSNSDSRIIQNHFLHCFNVFISCWRARPSLTSSRHSLNRLYHNWTCVLLIVDSPNITTNISNVLAHLISFFYTKYSFFGPFFWIVKNRREHQNTVNLFSCQKQTDNPKWLILSRYTRVTDMCTNITEKKWENQTYVIHEIWK